MSTQPRKSVDVVANPNPDRDYEIDIECPEFTCVCPKTGQPDFAVIRVTYVPDELLVELKSLKLYLWSYRDRGIYHEAAVNKILDDLVDRIAPRWMEISGEFAVRGGLATTVTVEYKHPAFDAE